METTTNYGLKTYESGDLFNPLTTDNVNMETIDTDLKAVSDRAIGRATELVSQGVHAITVLDTDCKTIKWVATANFTAGETFTINGIQCNAYLPSGEALGTNAYVTGVQVIGSLNDDNSAMTVYVPQGSVAVASDSERLGGELPAYYATKAYADGIKSTADTASTLIQRKALVNTYYDSSDNKLYKVNADGTQGGEINMFPTLDFDNAVTITSSAPHTTTKRGALIGAGEGGSSVIAYINNIPVGQGARSGGQVGNYCIQFVPIGVNITVTGSQTNAHITFVPYK